MIDGRVAAVHSRGARVDATSSYGAARAAIARCRAADFIGLVKPRVISLAIFTALVGLVCNPGEALASAELSPTKTDASAPLLPAINKLRGVAAAVAIKVARQAQKDGVAEDLDPALETEVERLMWVPEYRPYRRVEAGRPRPGGARSAPVPAGARGEAK